MSVILPIEMPKYCYDCPLCHEGRCGVTDDCAFDKRPYDCPMQEVKHGKWIGEVEMLFNGRTQAYEEIITKYICSCCGAVERDRFPYCHCGAKMDEEEVE